jgi:RNA polymerase sigma factor (sigma-70 family)
MSFEGFQELLRQAQSGHAESMDRLWTLARPCLRDLCRRYDEPHRGDGDSDRIQAVVLRACQSLDQFRGSRDDEQAWLMFRAWLATIVQRVTANEARDRMRQRRHPLGGIVSLGRSPDDSSAAAIIDPVESAPTPGTQAQADEEAVLVRAAIERIPDGTDQQIVWLRFFEELSLQQIAQRLDLSYDKTRDRYQKSLKWLAQELSPLL